MRNGYTGAGALLHLPAGEHAIIAVIGCGGKTSFVESQAAKLRKYKVLVSPTTKILPMKTNGVLLRDTLRQCVEHQPQTGVQCLGVLNAESGKLEALPEAVLADMATRYDIALLEADGSRGLPCKGWKDDEPVIPRYCTHTVGFVTMKPLGKPATQSIVHNLPEFLSLTGLREGDPITQDALVAMVCAPGGMFKTARAASILP